MSAKRVRPASKASAVPKAADAPAPASAPQPEWVAKLAALGQSPLGYILASILVLLPCFWQARIQAGDLSSHIYNSWLAQLIERGQAPGLALVRQSNNVLFDLMLG